MTQRRRLALWLVLWLTLVYGMAYHATKRLDARLSQPDAAATCSPSASPTHTRSCP
jgi:hypothetical protein